MSHVNLLSMEHHDTIDWLGIAAFITSLGSIAAVYWGIIKEKHFTWRRDIYQDVYEYMAKTDRIFRSYLTESPINILDNLEKLGMEKLNAQASIFASPKVVPLIDKWLASRDSCHGALLRIEISTDIDDRPQLWTIYKTELKSLRIKSDEVLHRIRKELYSGKIEGRKGRA